MDRLTAAQVFVAIAERPTLSAAADSLGMSRAMVSRYLQEMERWAGLRLLHRTTRRIALTAGGEETLARCRALLGMAGEVAQPADECGAPVRGHVRMSCSHSMGQATLAAAVAGFHREHPQVAVELLVDNRSLNLVEDRIDLAVRLSHALGGQLIARQLGTCASVLCASPRYLQRRGVPLDPGDLPRHACLAYVPLGRGSWTLRSRATGIVTEVPVAACVSANDSLFLLAAALDDGGITMQPLLSAAPHLESGRLVRVLPGHEPLPLPVSVVYASRRHMPAAVRSMLEHLVRWFGRAEVRRMLGNAERDEAPERHTALISQGL